MQNRKNKGRFGDEASQRQLRVSELIKRNISKILIDSNFYDQDRKNYSASVSEVRCSADLKIATVYVLPFNQIDPQELTSFLGKNKNAIRHALGKELSLKYLPDLRFKEDTLFKQIEKTNQIFRALEKD
tara:strand:- start:439 stop:825 length:387 start_codon:yes stop_codon:yes gene_type:complete